MSLDKKCFEAKNLNKISRGKMSVDKIYLDKMSLDKIYLINISLDKIGTYILYLLKMSLGKMS